MLLLLPLPTPLMVSPMNRLLAGRLVLMSAPAPGERDHVTDGDDDGDMLLIPPILVRRMEGEKEHDGEEDGGDEKGAKLLRAETGRMKRKKERIT